MTYRKLVISDFSNTTTRYIYSICPKCGQRHIYKLNLSSFKDISDKQCDSLLYTNINTLREYDEIKKRYRCPYCNTVQPWCKKNYKKEIEKGNFNYPIYFNQSNITQLEAIISMYPELKEHIAATYEYVNDEPEKESGDSNIKYLNDNQNIDITTSDSEKNLIELTESKSSDNPSSNNTKPLKDVESHTPQSVYKSTVSPNNCYVYTPIKQTPPISVQIEQKRMQIQIFAGFIFFILIAIGIIGYSEFSSPMPTVENIDMDDVIILNQHENSYDTLPDSKYVIFDKIESIFKLTERETKTGFISYYGILFYDGFDNLCFAALEAEDSEKVSILDKYLSDGNEDEPLDLSGYYDVSTFLFLEHYPDAPNVPLDNNVKTAYNEKYEYLKNMPETTGESFDYSSLKKCEYTIKYVYPENIDVVGFIAKERVDLKLEEYWISIFGFGLFMFISFVLLIICIVKIIKKTKEIKKLTKQQRLKINKNI